MSSTMKAVVNETYGAPEVLQVREIPVPVPGAGEVQVRVHAASINGRRQGRSQEPGCAARGAARDPGYDVWRGGRPGRG